LQPSRASHFEAAPQPLEESLRLFRDLGDEHLQGAVTFNLAWAYEELGEHERAHELKEENLRRAEALGDDRARFFVLSSLAFDADREGRAAEALALFRESVRISHRLGDPVHTALGLIGIASLLAKSGGDGSVAATLLASAEQTHEDLGLNVADYIVKRCDDARAALRGQLGEEALAHALERGRKLSLDSAVELALKDSGLAE
jgi:tetratricopeptide (TPR) repeat protein